MGKIFCLMGKSAAGKNAIYKRLISDSELSLSGIVPYTTRPRRDDETDGVEYHFCTEERLSEFLRDGRVIELRSYDTVQGTWKYFTADDGQIGGDGDMLLIGTLETLAGLKGRFGNGRVIPIYIEAEDGVRLERALARERAAKRPCYEEMCRRFLTDQADFSELRLQKYGITPPFRFQNDDLGRVTAQIRDAIARCR